jgi:Carboxypeptidase regulatory-like domain/TonB dependent receptor
MSFPFCLINFNPGFRKSSLYLLTLALLMCAVTLLAPPVFAQIDRAELEGTVTDPSGRVIAGASIETQVAGTGLTAQQKTNPEGYYRFPGLAVGSYSVSVSSAGFRTTVISNVVLEVGQTRTLDIKLPVGATTEKVEVNAPDEPSNRTSAEAATVIRPDQLADLANNGRDWTTLSLLAPFAQDDGGGDQRTIRFAGRARDDNNFQIDGVDAGGIQEQAQKSTTRLQISQDAIEEYRVNSALYDVEYGTQAGGQIDAETKSGTNDLHGTVFGYLRNSYFDARSFLDFDISGNPAISPFRMGQYGTSLGGPIVKNKTFFFINYEGIRQLQFNGQQMIVPAGICCADFTELTPNSEPTEPFQKYVLDQAQNLGIGPTMCHIMQAFPWRASAGTIDGCAPHFVYPDGAFAWQGSNSPGSVSTLNNQDQITVGRQTTIHEDTWLVRIDQKITDKTLLYGRAQRDISIWYAPATNPAVPGDNQATINHPANYMLALQHTFSPTLLNEAKLYINRSPFHNPGGSALPYAVNTNSFVSLNNTSADIEVGTTYGGIDNLTWVHGRHAFKAGMEIRRVRLNQGQTSNNVLSFGDDYSLATASLSSLDYIAPWCCHRLRRTFYMPYFQDEFKVTPTFTFTAGVRWDYYGVATEATNRTTVFDLNEFHGVCLGSGSYNVAPSPGPINTPPCPRNPALYNASYRNFDPRLALAWAPEKFQGKTVFRAGYGIYHGAAQNDDLNAGLESDTFRLLVNSTTQLQPAYAQQDPDLSAIAGKQANHPRALQREGRRDLYVETWGLTVEHQLPANFLYSMQYIGSRGVHLFSRGGVNLCTEPVTINISNSFGVDCVRTLDPYYPNGNPFGSVDIKRDIGASTYHGLEASLERRLTNGLSFQSRYTWSHSINDGSVGGGESTGPENVNCLECDKGPSIYDVRNNITLNTEYELPLGPGKQFLNHGGAMGKVIGGWSLSSIGLWHTGHPLTVQMDLSGTIDPTVFPNSPFAQNGLTYNYLLPDGNDQTNQRPDIIPGVPVMLSHPHPAGPNGGGSPLVNPAAFQAPPLDANGNFTRFGNEPNGVIRAPNIWQIDLALTKATKLTERLSMEFAVQAFNIFNHVQLADPLDLTLSYAPTQSNLQNLGVPGDFGLIDSSVNFNSNNDNAAAGNTGTGTPRQLQFMVRFSF